MSGSLRDHPGQDDEATAVARLVGVEKLDAYLDQAQRRVPRGDVEGGIDLYKKGHRRLVPARLARRNSMFFRSLIPCAAHVENSIRKMIDRGSPRAS